MSLIHRELLERVPPFLHYLAASTGYLISTMEI
jgi:hypothetical protein